MHINLLFNLIGKCHENLSKSLFATFQRMEETGLSENRVVILNRIEELPRANCFNE